MKKINKAFRLMSDSIDEVLVKLDKIDEKNLQNKSELKELLRLTKEEL